MLTTVVLFDFVPVFYSCAADCWSFSHYWASACNREVHTCFCHICIISFAWARVLSLHHTVPIHTRNCIYERIEPATSSEGEASENRVLVYFCAVLSESSVWLDASSFLLSHTDTLFDPPTQTKNRWPEQSGSS